MKSNGLSLAIAMALAGSAWIAPAAQAQQQDAPGQPAGSVAREAQALTTPEAKEQLKAELGERVVSLDQARAVRKGKAVAAKDRVHG